MGKLSNQRGKTFEREIAQDARAVFPKARRHLEYHEQDANGVDLLFTDEFKIQCKRGRQYAPITKIFEVQCERVLGEVPVLVTRGDDQEAMAILPWAEFLRLAKNSRGVKSEPA